MNTRLKALRKSLKLTQADFGGQINISKSTIEKMEYGTREVTERTLQDICRNFNVNEEWLRTGEGEMFRPRTKAQEIADITEVLINAEEHPNQNLKARAILYKAVHSLTDAQIKAVMDFAEQLYKEMNEK